MMTQNNSKFRSSFKAATIIPFFLILGITFGCEPTSMKKDNQIQNITLELADSETVKLNGESISITDFESQFSGLLIDPKNAIIALKVDKSASMGIIAGVQEVLRENGALKINYSIIQSKESQLKQIQSTGLRNRNTLGVYINEKGDIIVNEKQASLTTVERVVKEFITNDGENASLAESPKDAIIAIKTDKRTPYAIYSSALEKVMEVYDELRNQASMKVFGKPFQSLEAGSDEKTQIENMYPKNIGIAEPSQS